MSEAILRFENVSVAYESQGGVAAKQVLRNVSFTIAPGESFGIAGETGAGKSTLARAAAALESLKTGRIFVGDQCIAAAQQGEALGGAALRKLRPRFQILFQDPGSCLSPRMTVGSIVAEGALAHRLWQKSESRLRVAALLEQMNLSPKMASRFINELSGGERRRVAFARVYAVEPRLLILDEPTAGLDPQILEDFLALVSSASAIRHTSLLVISHDLLALKRLTGTMAIMRQGEFVEMGTTAEVFSQPQCAYAKALIEAGAGDVAWIADGDARGPGILDE